MEENPIKFNNNSYGAIYGDKQLLDQHHDEEQQQHFNHSKLRLLNDDAEEQQQQQQIFIEKISTVNSQDGDKLVDAADEGGKKKKEGAKTRDLIAFFICGLLNNYSYVIMLSAAEDLIHGQSGIVLLADILPTLFLKALAPFFMHAIPYNIRVGLAVLLALASFQMVAWFDNIYLKLVGVVLASLSSGGGEITFLAMSSYYHKNTISAWSSGTGGAGIFGALSYLALKGWLNLSPSISLSIITPLPLLMLLATFLIMSGSHYAAGFCSRGRGMVKESSTPTNPLTMKEKIKLVLPLALKYMLPLTTVYFAEYAINQGVSPNLTFRKELIPKKDDYVYYQFLYQTGVFISRSSVNIFPIKRLWVPAVLQCCLFIFLFLDAYFRFVPVIFFTFCFILFEGFLGGATYVNTYYCISTEVPVREREFSMSVVSVSDAIGISLAGLVSVFLQPWLFANQSKRL
ncbi:predicted protein [Naegleria gruberi]|uniref:Predicted protein n=1 Tax=Naegleria gruberi TaxID=5762 RepID=D2V7G5_NAEGR|nr:uncharacterized protein NAEGRDRAFT_31765 [Naegleria gruberi]EFC47374.1 predicted protein [Naegleria gruberi]|eukprot:XP_002680118.1 predicted protein [Naegleria gruberi strain NEG-M]